MEKTTTQMRRDLAVAIDGLWRDSWRQGQDERQQLRRFRDLLSVTLEEVTGIDLPTLMMRTR